MAITEYDLYFQASVNDDCLFDSDAWLFLSTAFNRRNFYCSIMTWRINSPAQSETLSPAVASRISTEQQTRFRC